MNQLNTRFPFDHKIGEPGELKFLFLAEEWNDKVFHMFENYAYLTGKILIVKSDFDETIWVELENK